MVTSQYTLLLTVIVFSSCNNSCEAIFINTSWEFEQHLCNRKYFNEKILLELDSSVVYSITINSFCFGMSLVDVTIRSSTNSPAVISCGSSAYYDDIPVPKLGLAFIDSLVTLQGLTFMNCGTYLNKLPDDVIDIFNFSSLYYSSTHAAALLFLHCRVNVSEVELISSYGFAVIGINLMDSIIHNVKVSHSSASAIMYNYYNETIGCGMILHFLRYKQTDELKSHKVFIEQSIFSSNCDLQNRSCANDIDLQSPFEMVVSAAALTILYQHDYQANVFIDHSLFKDNLGTTGGAVLILHYNSHHGSFVNINNSDFKNNDLLDLQQCYGADVSFIFLSSLKIQTSNDISVPLIIENTIIQNDLLSPSNQRYFKARAIYIGVKKNDPVNMNMLLKNMKCNNAAAIRAGVCMFAEMLEIYKTESVSVTLESIDAINNTLSSIFPYAGMFAFRRVNCYINGTKEKPSTLRNNLGVVIDATDSNIYLSGYILFEGNKGISGAAIKMKYGSRLHFMNGLTANFTNNQAVLGGAIYADVNNKQGECAFYFQSNDIKLFFHNNIATEAGNDIYAFPIYHCQFDDSSNSHTPYQALSCYEQMFHLFDHPGNTLWSISTKPTKLHLNNTMTSNGDIYTYPGQMVSLNLSALDELNRFVYTNVKVDIIAEERDSSSHLWLSYEDKVQIIQESRYKNYTHISFTVHTTTVISNQSFQGMLILSLPDYPEVVYSEIHIHPCPLGFVLDNITTGDCVCSPVLYAFAKDNSIPMTCSIQTQTFTRSSITLSWAGLIESEDGIKVFGISRSCSPGNCLANPGFVDYFQSTGETELFVAHQTDGKFNRTPLCINHREGPLCGKCKDGLSVVFGSQKCMHCSNKWIWTALVQVASGPIIIYLLYALRLTLTTGTLNGIIFYAQAANGGLTGLLLLHSGNIVLTVAGKFVDGFLSILNLNLGFPLCLYDGMTELLKTGLSLVFPIYLLIIVVILIILSRYSIWLSNRISHSSVQVLVTVVHLSFSKLLKAIIDVFTPARIYTDNGYIDVWRLDGTVRYLSPQHCNLVIYVSLTVFPLIVPYIALLLLAKPLRRCSLANSYLRPVLEAIHAPYKEGKKYWFVLRLVLIIYMYVMFTVYSGKQGLMIYLVTTPILMLFLVAQAFVKPFKNNFLNIMDTWLTFNITFLYTTTWFYVITHQIDIIVTISVVCVLLVFINFFLILVYHFLWVSGLLAKVERKISTAQQEIVRHLDAFHKDDSRTHLVQPGHDDSFYDSCREYREPILSS